MPFAVNIHHLHYSHLTLPLLGHPLLTWKLNSNDSIAIPLTSSLIHIHPPIVMSKYNQKPYTAEEKKKAIETFSEKIQYSPRYSSELHLSSLSS
jgi:hypothetical protein